MYTHDLFYLQPEWEAWLAPVYKQTTNTMYKIFMLLKLMSE